METAKNKLREFGVFMALTMFPVFLIVYGICTTCFSIDDYNLGFIQLWPSSSYSGGLVCTLIGSLVMIALGIYIVWASNPIYKEYMNKCGSK